MSTLIRQAKCLVFTLATILVCRVCNNKKNLIPILPNIDGEFSDVEIAEIFKSKFNKTSDCADSLSVDDINIHSYVDVI